MKKRPREINLLRTHRMLSPLGLSRRRFFLRLPRAVSGCAISRRRDERSRGHGAKFGPACWTVSLHKDEVDNTYIIYRLKTSLLELNVARALVSFVLSHPCSCHIFPHSRPPSCLWHAKLERERAFFLLLPESFLRQHFPSTSILVFCF